jgi:hypothetical protein
MTRLLLTTKTTAVLYKHSVGEPTGITMGSRTANPSDVPGGAHGRVQMTFLRSAALLVAGSLLVGPGVRAADRAVHLRVPPPIRHNVASMPQIVDPADAAENRINTQLHRLDVTVGKAVGACKLSDGKPGDWQRTIDVPMRGPGYISFVLGIHLTGLEDLSPRAVRRRSLQARRMPALSRRLGRNRLCALAHNKILVTNRSVRDSKLQDQGT